eukprot:jgi/Tetstr1/420270/TSEL_000139.t1
MPSLLCTALRRGGIASRTAMPRGTTVAGARTPASIPVPVLLARGCWQRRSGQAAGGARGFRGHVGATPPRRRLPHAARSEAAAAAVGGAKADEPLLKLPGLKKEVARRQTRVTKKVAKASERLRAAEQQVEALLADESADLDALERCPDTMTIEAQLDELRTELTGLNELAAALDVIKSASDKGYPAACQRARELDVDDEPPKRPARGPKKPKGKKPPPRKPYWIYSSVDDIEIRVGRGASDNDSLSCSPAHRDGQDWWMHVAGHPGSHVVVRSHDDDVPMETMQDAAALAAKFSKAPQQGKVAVNVVRCRQVSKPPGAKPGLVQLSGEIRTLRVNVKTETARIDRLEDTKSASMDSMDEL